MAATTVNCINLDDKLNFIDEHITAASQYEMLAEEATELAHASLKMARLIRNENPTPVSFEEAFGNVQEEWNDLYLVQKVLSLTTDYVAINRKLDRWVERLTEKETADVHSDT